MPDYATILIPDISGPGIALGASAVLALRYRIHADLRVRRAGVVDEPR